MKFVYSFCHDPFTWSRCLRDIRQHRSRLCAREKRAATEGRGSSYAGCKRYEKSAEMQVVEERRGRDRVGLPSLKSLFCHIPCTAMEEERAKLQAEIDALRSRCTDGGGGGCVAGFLGIFTRL